jgi:hypothetical protein
VQKGDLHATLLSRLFSEKENGVSLRLKIAEVDRVRTGRRWECDAGPDKQESGKKVCELHFDWNGSGSMMADF